MGLRGIQVWSAMNGCVCVCCGWVFNYRLISTRDMLPWLCSPAAAGGVAAAATSLVDLTRLASAAAVVPLMGAAVEAEAEAAVVVVLLPAAAAGTSLKLLRFRALERRLRLRLRARLDALPLSLAPAPAPAPALALAFAGLDVASGWRLAELLAECLLFLLLLLAVAGPRVVCGCAVVALGLLAAPTAGSILLEDWLRSNSLERCWLVTSGVGAGFFGYPLLLLVLFLLLLLDALGVV